MYCSTPYSLHSTRRMWTVKLQNNVQNTHLPVLVNKIRGAAWGANGRRGEASGEAGGEGGGEPSGKSLEMHLYLVQ